MNSYERVQCCLNHEPADRLPVDGYFRDGVWSRLAEWFGTKDHEQIRCEIGIDFRQLELQPTAGFRARAARTPHGWRIAHPDGSLEDEWGTRVLFDGAGEYYRFVFHPLADKAALASYTFPGKGDVSRFPPPRSDSSKQFMVLAQNSNLWKLMWHVRGLDQSLMDLADEDEDFVDAILDQALDWQLDLVRQQAAWGVDIIGAVGDIAMQDRMTMKPATWRRFFKQREARVIEEARRGGMQHFYFHSDGNMSAILDDLVEIGVDIINPVQPECMDLAEIKRRYGTKLTMHGTVSAQHTLPFGTPAEVQQEVLDRIAVCGYNGGLVLAPNNVVQHDVPLENLLAIYQTVKSVGASAYHS